MAAANAHHHHTPASDHDSASSTTPRSDHPQTTHPGHHVRLMCSFGGRILPRPHDNQLRYVGGETRIVSVNRSINFTVLLAKLSKLAGLPSDMSVKYQLPHEDLDALISVTTDEDVDNMMEEYDRLAASMVGSAARATPRLRLFLFPPIGSTGFDSTVSKRQSWFVDALNGVVGTPLDRGRSEVSSVISEMPDYLFGFDNNSDEHREAKTMSMQVLGSEPESPPPSGSPPPVKTKPEAGPEVDWERHAHGTITDSTGFSSNPVWQQYSPQPVPVYYVPGPIPMHMQVPYGQQVQVQVQPVGYQNPVQGMVSNPAQPGLVYVSGSTIARTITAGQCDFQHQMGDGYDFPAVATAADGVRYIGRGPAMVPVYPTVGVPLGGEIPVTSGAEIQGGDVRTVGSRVCQSP